MSKHFLASPLLVCGLFAAAATYASTAHAQTATVEYFTFDFTYDPAHLQSEKGANKVLARLERDVRRHCGGDVRVPVGDRKIVDTCIDRTMRGSIEKFDSNTLNAAYQSRAAG